MGNRLFGIHLGASALKPGRCRRKRGTPAHVIVQEYSCHPAGVLDEAVDAGAEVITLGNRILRTETAGMMLLSVLMFNMEGK